MAKELPSGLGIGWQGLSYDEADTGTVNGITVIPGLYYLFAKIGDGRKLIKDEHDEPLSELFERDDRKDSIDHAQLGYHSADGHSATCDSGGGDSGGQPETGAES